MEFLYIFKRLQKRRPTRTKQVLNYFDCYLYGLNRFAKAGSKSYEVIIENNNDCAILAIRLLCRRLSLKYIEKRIQLTYTQSFIVYTIEIDIN